MVDKKNLLLGSALAIAGLGTSFFYVPKAVEGNREFFKEFRPYSNELIAIKSRMTEYNEEAELLKKQGLEKGLTIDFFDLSSKFVADDNRKEEILMRMEQIKNDYSAKDWYIGITGLGALGIGAIMMGYSRKDD